jgi:septum formation protein
LLRNLGLRFAVDPSDLPEELSSGQSIAEAVVELALSKARDVALRHPNALIVAADTLVSLDGNILGKPANVEDAGAMLQRLSGRRHQVYTGLVVLTADSGGHETRLVETDVWFRHLSAGEIDVYLHSGEPLDKAGAYGLQALGSLIVERVEGDYFNVIGLPLVALNELMLGMGCCLLCRSRYDTATKKLS